MMYFELIDKVTGEVVSPIKVDDLLCKEVYNTEPDTEVYGGTPYVFNWFNTIGFMLATGLTLQDGEGSVREYYKNKEMWAEELPIIEKTIDFLQTKFTCRSAYFRGKVLISQP